jgi:hypothetical protein
MKVFNCLICFLFCQSLIIAQAPDYTKDTYKPLSGKVLGADATMYLHMGKGGVSGYLILIRDPKPFALREHYDGHRRGDSLFLTATRSPGISIELKLRWQADSITGYAEMLADPSLTGNQQSLRKGRASLQTSSGHTPYSFTSLQKDETLPMKLPHNPTFRYLSGTVWPPEQITTPWAKTMETQIKNWLEQKQGAASPGAMLAAHSNRLLNPWKKDIQAVPASELKSWGPSMLEREYSDEIRLMYESDFFLVLARSTHSYTGGAHGNYAFELVTIDKRTGKTLKAADVLTQQGMVQLPKLLETAFRQQFGMDAKKTLEQNGALVKAMPLNDNFYMTDAGIGFWYSPYEVMPFVYSDIMVVVPLAAVQALISPVFLGAGK